jgi:hypothetical protein
MQYFLMPLLFCAVSEDKLVEYLATHDEPPTLEVDDRKHEDGHIGVMPTRFGAATVTYEVVKVLDKKNMIVEAMIFNRETNRKGWIPYWVSVDTERLKKKAAWKPRGLFQIKGVREHDLGFGKEKLRRLVPYELTSEQQRKIAALKRQGGQR